MTVYISNLVAGLDKGLDHTELLLEMTGPFGGRVGIEFFIHTYSEAYMEADGAYRRVGGETAAGPPRPLSPGGGHQRSGYGGVRRADRVLRPGVRSGAALWLRAHGISRPRALCEAGTENGPAGRCLENIGELIRLAKPWGVRLLLENLALPVKGTPLFDQDEYIGLFDRFPDADCLIDVGHLGVAGWDMETVIGSLAGASRATICTTTMEPTTATAGSGTA